MVADNNNIKGHPDREAAERFLAAIILHHGTSGFLLFTCEMLDELIPVEPGTPKAITMQRAHGRISIVAMLDPAQG